MVYQLAIVIAIPLIVGIVFVSPFDTEVPEEEPENISDEPRTGITVLYIILGILWFIFLIRILRQIRKGTYRIRTKF